MGQWDHQIDGYTMRETHSFRERALVSEGEDVERNEESVEELVCQNRAQTAQPQVEDVFDVVQMVEVLCH